jgi:ribosomal protein S18 acetylase RimI-like enzyme
MTPDPQEYNVYFTRSLQATLPAPILPVGYTLRSLQGVAELEKYNTLYGFATVNLQYRQELLSSDEYSHLIVEDSSGTFVAYCECSICRAEWQLGNQKIGWIDYIGVKPEKRQQGLGRAILLASLLRLQAWGAETVRLITVSTNIPALKFYEATGFTPVTIPEALNYERNIIPDNE